MQCILLALIRKQTVTCVGLLYICAVNMLTTNSEPGAYRSSNKVLTFDPQWTSTRGSGFSYAEGHLGQMSPFSLAMLADDQVINRIRAPLQPELQSAYTTHAICSQLRHSMPFLHNEYF